MTETPELSRRAILVGVAGALSGCGGWDEQRDDPPEYYSIASADILIQDGRVGVSLTVCNDAGMTNGQPCISVSLLDEMAETVASRDVYYFVDDDECESHMAWFDDVEPAEAMELRATAQINRIGSCEGTDLEE